MLLYIYTYNYAYDISDQIMNDLSLGYLKVAGSSLNVLSVCYSFQFKGLNKFSSACVTLCLLKIFNLPTAMACNQVQYILLNQSPSG